MMAYTCHDGAPASGPLTSQQQGRAEGLAYARAWKARGGADERWRDYVAAHYRASAGAVER